MFRKMNGLLVLMLVFALVLSACSGGNDKTDETAEKEASQNDDTQTTDDNQADGEGAQAEETTPVDPFGKYEEPVKITGVLEYGPPTDEKVPSDTSPDNFSFIGAAKEKLNIEFEWLWTAPADQYEQKFGVAMVSGDLPDIMEVKRNDFEFLKNNGMLADLTDSLEYMSEDVERLLYSDESILDSVTNNGQVLAIPNYWDSKRNLNMMFIRQDWLDDLGLEIPTNPEELKTVMEKFVNEKGATTGIAMDKNLSDWGYDIRSVMAMFGSYPYAWIDDGNGGLVAGEITDETKKALQYLSELYAESIIVQDFATMDAGKMAELLTAGECGILFGPWWNYEWPLNGAKANDLASDWAVAPIPTNGDKGNALVKRADVASYYVVNSNCENPEALIKMMNMFIEGEKTDEPFVQPENGYVWQWVPTIYFNPFDIQTMHEDINDALSEDPAAEGPAPTSAMGKVYETEWELMNKYLKYDKGEGEFDASFGQVMSRMDSKLGWGTTMKIFDSGDVTYDEFYGGATDTMVAKQSTLNKLTEEIFIKIIMGAEPVSAFDQYKEDWLKLGGDKITEEVNQWYND